jgi:hypothetical protein
MDKRGLRLLLYESTHNPFLASWHRGLLFISWRLGVHFYRLLGRFDDCHGATDWEDGLSWLGNILPDRPIAEIQYWGHGFPGAARLNNQFLDVNALSSSHPLNPALRKIAQRLEGPGALWWFRVCSIFQGEEGQAFASAWSTFFCCRVAGFTQIIGPLQGGLHSLRPGQQPSWEATEGSESSWLPQWIRLGPHTITCLTGRIPDEW